MGNPVQIIIQGAANFQQVNEEFGKLSESSTNAFAKITNGIKLLTEAFLVEKVIELAREFSAEWIKSARGLAQLDAALKSTKQSSAEYAEELEAQRKAISATTGAEEDQIVAMQRHLVQYKASQDQIKELTELSLDLAASQGIDGVTASNLIARALGGQQVQLRGVRLEIDQALPKYEQVNQMVHQLANQVGGQARAAFLAAAPEITRFNNALKETEKGLGNVATGIATLSLRAAGGIASNAASAIGGFVPGRVQNQAKSLWESLKEAWGLGTTADSTLASNFASGLGGFTSGGLGGFFGAGFQDPLHQQKMDLQALHTQAGVFAAGLPEASSEIETQRARNEQLYAEGKRSLQEYLATRKALIIDEANAETIVMNAALAANAAEMEKKKKELDVVRGGTDLQQIEKVQQEYDKLLIENQKLKSEIAALTQKKQQGMIGVQTAEGPTNFGEAITSGWGQAVKDLGTVYSNLANTIRGTVGAAISGVSQGITGLITGTLTWGQALRNIGTSVLNIVIDGLVKMFAAWITGRQAASLVEIAATEAENAGKFIGALLTAVTSYGAAAVVGAAAFTAALGVGIAAAAGAFADGGRPPVGEVSIVGERGPELFVPDTAGTIIPAHVTSSILNGNAGAGTSARRAGRSGGQTIIHLHVWGDDAASMQKNIDTNPGVQHSVLQLVGKQQHLILRAR